MRSLPTLDEHDIVFAEPATESLLVSYYLGNTFPVYAVALNREKGWQPIKMEPTRMLYGAYTTVHCRRLAAITDLWIYGSPDRILTALPHWPGCLTTKKLWIFRDHAWQPLNPN